MLRDKNLIPLSHQHQRALALCVRIDRAAPIAETDLDAWQIEITQLCQQEILIHFAAEEAILFPVANGFPGLAPLISDLINDHAALRENFSQAEARSLKAADLSAFAHQMSTHIRKEERQLFERMQQLLGPEDLKKLGTQLAEALKESAQTCAIPSGVTKLRPSLTPGPK
jgi:iron-sulfur cluster repair protein YtfE (RIC family)